MNSQSRIWFSACQMINVEQGSFENFVSEIYYLKYTLAQYIPDYNLYNTVWKSEYIKI